MLGVDSHEADVVIISEGKKGRWIRIEKKAVVEITRKEIRDFDEAGDIQLAEIEETVEDIVKILKRIIRKLRKRYWLINLKSIR